MGKDSDVRLDGEAMKMAKRERGIRNLAAADPTGWTVHTDHHWSRTLAGKRLDYWPSRNKFQYDGRVMTGDVRGFITRRELPPERRPQPGYFVDSEEQ